MEINVLMETIGYLAGLCTAVCFLPQTIKVFISKDVSALSGFSYFFYCLGIVLWIVYGAYLQSDQMVIFNAISLCFALPIFIMILIFRKD